MWEVGTREKTSSSSTRAFLTRLRRVLKAQGMAQPESQSAHRGDAAVGKPNIIFILLDNVGWGDFGVYGGLTPTPRIDDFARQGIRLNNYNVESQCTPTRAAILSGRYSVRSGTYRVPFLVPPWPE